MKPINPELVQGWTLSAALKDPKRMGILLRTLDPEDFTGPERHIYDAMLASNNGHFDPLAFNEALSEPAKVRFYSVERDYQDIADPLTFQDWIKTIRAASESRLIVHALMTAQTQLTAGDKADAVLADLLMEVNRARERNKGETMVSLKTGVGRVRDIIARWDKGESDIETVPTGFDDLDRLTGGMVRKHITVLGGRPGMAKTQFALQVAHKVALWSKEQKRDSAVIVFSAEMSTDRLVMRLASSVSGVATKELRAKRASEEEKKLYLATLTALEGLPISVDETPDPTTAQMMARVAVEAMAHPDGIDLVIFDYLELAGETQGKNATGDDRIGRIMRGLKVIAKRFNCAVLALSHLNREVESRPTRLPEISDLRASGWVENLAQQVIFIMRPAAYGKQQPDTKAWQYVTEAVGRLAEKEGPDCMIVDVPKNRDGATGRVIMRFIADITRIAETYKGAKPASPSLPDDIKARAERQAEDRADWTDPQAREVAG